MLHFLETRRLFFTLSANVSPTMASSIVGATGASESPTEALDVAPDSPFFLRLGLGVALEAGRVSASPTGSFESTLGFFRFRVGVGVGRGDSTGVGKPKVENDFKSAVKSTYHKVRLVSYKE